MSSTSNSDTQTGTASNDSHGVRPLIVQNRRRLSWRGASLRAAACMWLPFVVTILVNHQVRRFGEDIWFWPGLLPSIYLFDDMYDNSFVLVAIPNLILWTLIIRRWQWPGMLGTLVHGTFSSLYLVAVAAM